MLQLTIAGAHSGVPLLPHRAPRVEVWREPDGTPCAYGYSVSGERWMHLPGLATFRFDSQSCNVTAFVDSPDSSDSVLDAFHRTVLPMALQARGLEVLHASAVRTPRGVAALCAVAETGKSTLACGLSQRGYPVWADDAVVFETPNHGVQALPLPFEIRVRSGPITSFDSTPPDSARARSPMPLAVVCVLERAAASSSRGPVEISRLSSARAFTAALTHAYCFDLHDKERKRRMMENYLDLVERVPVFEIRFQAGLDKLPVILDGIEQVILT
jgi:hypothetical protein